MEVPKNLIERWQRNINSGSSKKKRNLIKLAIILGLCAVAAFLIIFYMTDLISKPNEELGVVNNPGEWPMYGRDLARSGLEKLGDVVPKGEVTKVFTANAGMHSSPVIAGGVIYVGSRDGNLYAIQESSGQLLWSHKTESWVESSAAVVNNVVYFGSNDGKFRALNAKTGEKLWEYTARYPIKSSAAVAGGKVYFGGDDYTLHCLDAVTGKRIWSKETGGTINSSPAVSGGIVFFGSTDGNLYALDASNGRQRFRLNTRRIIVSSPIVSGDTVYFSTTDAVVFASDGKARNWFGEFIIRPPWQVLAFYGDLPAPPPPSGFLWSLLSWGDTSVASPTLQGENIYVGFAKKVVSINVSARGKQWETPVEDNVVYAGVLSQGIVYAATANGHLYLLETANGRIIRDIPIGGPIFSDPLMVDGKVYISSEDGNLYVVR
ncbi:MAG TPA: PQQ-binding-like beta-propeller repeat protein [Dehalococcoidales bacterium]|nr:PQQ-binding-like beta-propeller repeat protein [Dehalococcoidales bacterium]